MCKAMDKIMIRTEKITGVMWVMSKAINRIMIRTKNINVAICKL